MEICHGTRISDIPLSKINFEEKGSNFCPALELTWAHTDLPIYERHGTTVITLMIYRAIEKKQ